MVYTKWVKWRHYVSAWRELTITTVLLSTAVFFHGTYRGAKSVVPCNTRPNTALTRPNTCGRPESQADTDKVPRRPKSSVRQHQQTQVGMWSRVTEDLFRRRSRHQLLCRDGFQCDLLLRVGFYRQLLFVAKAPALDARDWIEHHSANNDAYSHHDERICVAEWDIIQPACTAQNQPTNQSIKTRLHSSIYRKVNSDPC